MMRTTTRGFGLAVLSLIAASCVPDVERPEVSMEGARLVSLGFSGGVVDVELSVYNPNRFDLRASGLTYDLEFEDPDGGGWIDFTEGRLDEDLEVAAGGTATIVIPVEFTYRGLGEIVGGLLERGTFDYRVSGVVAVEGPIRRDIRYDHTGSVSPGDVR